MLLKNVPTSCPAGSAIYETETTPISSRSESRKLSICPVVEIKGASLHSYRYAYAERAQA